MFRCGFTLVHVRSDVGFCEADAESAVFCGVRRLVQLLVAEVTLALFQQLRTALLEGPLLREVQVNHFFGQLENRDFKIFRLNDPTSTAMILERCDCAIVVVLVRSETSSIPVVGEVAGANVVHEPVRV